MTTHHAPTCSTTAVQQVTGLNERDIHFLCRQEKMAAPPSWQQGGRGTGNPREWTEAGVAEAVSYAILRTVLEVREVVPCCRAIGMFVNRNSVDDLDTAWLILNQSSITVTDHIDNVNDTDGISTVLPLHHVAARIRSIAHWTTP